MRTLFPQLTALFVATTAAAQSGSVQALEQACFRVTDNPRPAEFSVIQSMTERETGAHASFLRGCRLLAEQKFGPAGGEFEKAVNADPSQPIYHFWFGRATGEQAQRANPLRQPGLARRTKGEFERAVALDSGYIAPREGLLRYYLAAPGFLGGSTDRAREQAEAIAKLNAYRGAMAHGNVAVAAKDTAALIRVHEGLVASHPDSASSYLVLFNIQLVRKQYATAWAVLDRLGRARPDYPVLNYAIGRAAAESGEQLDRGEAALRAYLGRTPAPNEPSLAATHWRLGQLAEKRGDRATAKLEYQAATTIDPHFRQAKEALARLK
jgi:predicted Zn-dependent protease